ncbi:headcase protein homolog isoform X5 [Hyla sarda]|uniref:headcase protein homolog isoform X5 n=1 Tax=Hyla sarda TaxID=327740 RepID=UPI0024C26782|nr:headcase protein homolog isoform X5 [Hyla sarda]
MPNVKNSKGKKNKRANSSGDEQDTGATAAAAAAVAAGGIGGGGGMAAATAGAAAASASALTAASAVTPLASAASSSDCRNVQSANIGHASGLSFSLAEAACATPLICSLGRPVDLEKDDYQKVICNNEHCPFSTWMHLQCFYEWESSILVQFNCIGRARSWNEKQCRQNMWTKKGYDLAFRFCSCRCGQGHLKKDTDWYQVKRMQDEKKKKSVPEKTTGRLMHLYAVCVDCLEGVHKIICIKCKSRWDGSWHQLGTMYTYDILAASPCCQARLNCKHCGKPVIDVRIGMQYFSEYSNVQQCPHCGNLDYHFVKPFSSFKVLEAY